MNKNILLIRLENSNLGDSIIADTCEYIIKDTNKDVDVTRIHLFPPKQIMKKFKHYPFVGFQFLISVLKRMKIYLIKYNCLRWQAFIKNNSEAYNYYYLPIKNADKVIIAGGGLIKYSREDLWNAIHTISEICEMEEKPLYINAAGIEGYDEKNYRCKVLREALSRENVLVTTRDDLETLKKYLKDPPKANLVGDPALYSAATYQIKAEKESNCIGIGIIRGKIYTDYGLDFKEQNIINCYVNLIKLLEKRGQKWQIFCNGNEADYNLALKVLEKLGLTAQEKYIATKPTTPRELLEIVSKYKAIIAARLHANIIATSLGVPSVGLVWNDKLKLFGKLIGCENRFIEKENFIKPEYVIEQLEEAIQNGYDENKIKSLKDATKCCLDEFLKK